MNIKLTESGKGAKVAFAGSALPLAQRTQEDLVKLAIMATETGNPSMLAHFDGLPSLSKLKQLKTDAELEKISAEVLPPSVPALNVIGNGNPDNKPVGGGTPQSEANAAALTANMQPAAVGAPAPANSAADEAPATTAQTTATSASGTGKAK